MRVVYLSHAGQISGAELAAVRLLEAAPSITATVILAEDGPLVARFEGAGARVEVMPLGASAQAMRRESVRPGGGVVRALPVVAGYTWRLARRLRALRPDLVHTVSMKAALYGSAAARLAGRPVLWNLHDRLSPDYLPAPAVPALRLLAGTLPTALVTPSRYALARAGRLHRPGMIRAVLPQAVPRPTRRHELRIPVRRVGIVGRITPWKGQHVFLDAFAQAFPEGTTRGVVVGSALFGEHEYERGLRVRAEQLGIADRIEFSGFRSDVDAELARLDILVHASVLADPLATVVLEGLAAGLPIICTDDGGHAEYVRDGVHALTVPPGDAAALARAMRRLAADDELRARLSRDGSALAERFAPPVIAQEALDLYRRVAAAGRPAR